MSSSTDVGDAPPQFTLEHENAGWIAALGSGTRGWKEGRRCRGLALIGIKTMKATAVPQYSVDVPKATLAAENPVLGTWKLQSLVFEAIATGQRSSPFGDNPVGYISYSPDSRMYAIGVVEHRPKPRDLFPTDQEKAKLQESMFAYAGTYMGDGEKVIHHVDISWNGINPGPERT